MYDGPNGLGGRAVEQKSLISHRENCLIFHSDITKCYQSLHSQEGIKMNQKVGRTRELQPLNVQFTFDERERLILNEK